MKDISSPSVRDTPSPEPEPDTSGTPPIEESSGSISPTSTAWTVVMYDGTVQRITLPGRGRISFGGGRGDGAQVRFYRDKSTKFYDAVIPNVGAVFSEDVMVEDLGKTTAAKAAEEARDVWEKKRSRETAEYLAKEMVDRVYRAKPEEDDEI